MYQLQRILLVALMVVGFSLNLLASDELSQENKNLLQSVIELVKDEYIDETNEDDRHVAGNMNVSLESKNKSESIIGLVEKFINQNSLGGECWALTDEAGQLLITEETIEFK